MSNFVSREMQQRHQMHRLGIREESFTLTAAWLEGTVEPTPQQIFLEHRYSVDYHLSRTHVAARSALSHLAPHHELSLDDYKQRFEWVRCSFHGTDVRVSPPHDLIEVSWRADEALGAAVSSLETALLLINRVMKTNVPRDTLKWAAGKPKDQLRTRLAQISESAGLIRAIDQIFGDGQANATERKSKGYAVLSNYRNWMTHRGAPILDTNSVSDPFRIPDHVYEGYDITDLNWVLDRRTGKPDQSHSIQQLRWLIDLEIEREISRRVRIWSKPFVPPASFVIDQTFENIPEEGVELPGGLYLSSVGRAFINQSYQTGSLFEPSTAFENANPHRFEVGDKTVVADEELVAYELRYFLSAVNQVIFFVRQTLEVWDAELANLLQKHASTT